MKIPGYQTVFVCTFISHRSSSNTSVPIDQDQEGRRVRMREPCEESVREIVLEVASSLSSGRECDLWVLMIVVWIAKYNVSEDAKDADTLPNMALISENWTHAYRSTVPLHQDESTSIGATEGFHVRSCTGLNPRPSPPP